MLSLTPPRAERDWWGDWPLYTIESSKRTLSWSITTSSSPTTPLQPPKKPDPQCNHLPHCGKIIIFVPRAASRSPVWASGRGVNGLGEDRSKTLASARRLILDHTKCGNFLFSVKSEATADVCADVYFCDTHISGVGFCVARSTE